MLLDEEDDDDIIIVQIKDFYKRRVRSRIVLKERRIRRDCSPHERMTNKSEGIDLRYLGILSKEEGGKNYEEEKML